MQIGCLVVPSVGYLFGRDHSPGLPDLRGADITTDDDSNFPVLAAVPPFHETILKEFLHSHLHHPIAIIIR